MKKETFIDAYTGDESVPVFIAFAIEQFKNHRGISGKEAAALLDEAGILSHLAEFYDVLHTQSAQWLVAEMEEMIANYNSKR